jgi:hypothetical protein
VCGEHGGDPESIRTFAEAGLDYVSCSPFRVPIARLAAAQCVLAGLVPPKPAKSTPKSKVGSTPKSKAGSAPKSKAAPTAKSKASSKAKSPAKS